MLHRCELAVRNADHDSRPTPATHVLPPTPAVSIALAADSSEADVNANFAMRLSQQEAAFVAKRQKTAAKEEKKAMRQSRIAHLLPIGTTTDLGSRWYLPTLVKCA